MSPITVDHLPFNRIAPIYPSSFALQELRIAFGENREVFLAYYMHIDCSFNCNPMLLCNPGPRLK